MYFYNPIIEYIARWWSRFWGTDEDKELPIKPSRLLIVLGIIIGTISIFGSPILLLHLLDKDNWNSEGVNLPLSLFGVIYIVLSLLVLTIPSKIHIARRAWLGGKGKWWQ